jgi:hypothetical protein
MTTQFRSCTVNKYSYLHFILYLDFYIRKEVAMAQLLRILQNKKILSINYLL